MTTPTSPQRIALYDTTLRDGNQAIGIGLSLKDKLQIARKLAELGMDYIEGGWPTPTNTIDTEFFQQATRSPYRDKIAVFGSTRRKGERCEQDPLIQALVASQARVATIFGKSWDLHVEQVITTTLSENLDMISETVSFLKRHFDEVIYDAEHFFDGYRANPEYALKTLAAAAQAGADCLVLCDTNGGMLPDSFTQIYQAVKSSITTPLGVHLHNDSGCAAANSFIAALEGTAQIQGTINGLGERCGNANLCTIIPGLQLKRGFQLLSDEQLRQLTSISIYISEIANIQHDIRQPYVGMSAFSHKAGTHADGVRKVRASFEHVPPESIGNTRHFVVSDQAGSSTIVERIHDIQPGLDKKDPRVRQVLSTIQQREAEGYQYEAADGSFELMVRQQLGQFDEPFSLGGFRVIEEKREDGQLFSEATIKIREAAVTVHTAADGDGPVNALDNAIRKALAEFFPALKVVHLEDFKVRVLSGHDGTAAKVRVLITSSDLQHTWTTIGVSSNIIEASWIALTDSLKYKLMRESLGALPAGSDSSGQ
jgi:2-isopropylmalate synthase